jgi:hypothetical protein
MMILIRLSILSCWKKQLHNKCSTEIDYSFYMNFSRSSNDYLA